MPIWGTFLFFIGGCVLLGYLIDVVTGGGTKKSI